MNKFSVAVCLGMGALFCLQEPLQAHHSNAQFDDKKEVELKGVVKELRWTNPHTLVVLTVVDAKGTAVDWHLEGRAPGVLARSGWTRNAVKPGDPLMITVHLARDGSNTALIWATKRPDGKPVTVQGDE